ncbi:hypothetical protein [Streptomyces sp. NPDC048845]|uniref:hypothetical protein n=1 Tax=Streptomyces sp. NPDC048845 TaxID=3155390 RepID=UPI0034328766
MLWAMISGPGLATVSEARLAEDWRNLLDLVRHVIGLCDGPTHLSPRHIQSRDSDELHGRLQRLPEGWRQEVVRRIAAGANMASTIADAQMAINRLRSRGIDPAAAATPEFETAADR